jgi:hypothetical protein
MKQLSPDDVSIIVNEYTKYIENGFVLDGLISGIAAYLTFISLHSNSIFVDQLPFHFNIPSNTNICDNLNRNMFRHLSLPIMSLAKISTGVLKQLTLFIQSFINIWEPLFIQGQDISPSMDARLSIEIISGFSDHVASTLYQTQLLNESLFNTLNQIELRLQNHIDESLNKIKREVNNIVIEARDSVRQTNQTLLSKLDFVDDNVREKVNQITTEELNRKISSLIDAQLNERIINIVKENNNVPWLRERWISKK